MGWGGTFLGVGARCLLPAMSTLILVTVAGMQEPVALAAGCPNEPMRARQVHAVELPDCRAYEQVSPVDKNGVNAVGGLGIVQASPDGARVAYASEAPFPQATGSQGGTPFYLSARSLTPEWSTFGLTPPTEPGPVRDEHQQNYISGSTEDLTRTVVVEEEQALAPGATSGKPNAYVRDNATGAYQLLAGDLAQPPLIYLADATPGGTHIIFETREELAVTSGPKAAPGVTNLYEWDETKAPAERLSVVGVLPASEGGEAPAAGSHAGGAGATTNSPTHNTISQDGSRVFFTDAGTERIYMRMPHAKPAVSIPISAGAARWQATTPTGSFVFYAEGSELYRFNVDVFEESAKPEPEALSEAREQITSGAEGVEEVLGVSDDGTYASFVALGVLAINTREYTNTKGETVVEKALTGAHNLYQWHEGAPSPVFVAGFGVANGSEGNGARVSADGKTILFASDTPLTGYPNGASCEENGGLRGEPCNEYFRYAADTGRLSCVSCSPAQTSVTAEPFMIRRDQSLTVGPKQLVRNFATRNLSDDGTRVFFETEEALVPQDQNHQNDVYEWEAQGAGSCTPTSTSPDPVSGGCLYLISTGQSAQTSYFGDASADGSSVLFFTLQPLVSQDQDNNQDIYDARVSGGISAQNAPPPVPPCSGDACRGAGEAPPVSPAPASGSLSGTGNFAALPPPAPPKKCVKGKRLSHGRCIAPRRKCPKGRKRSHGRCVKARAARRGRAEKAAGHERNGTR
jgi:WD40-like Beta Propeller Repeat